MAKKGIATKVRLLSTGKTAEGDATGYTYYVKKGKNATEKLSLKKFDPRAVNAETGKTGAHVKFEEKKLPPAKK